MNLKFKNEINDFIEANFLILRYDMSNFLSYYIAPYFFYVPPFLYLMHLFIENSLSSMTLISMLIFFIITSYTPHLYMKKRYNMIMDYLDDYPDARKSFTSEKEINIKGSKMIITFKEYSNEIEIELEKIKKVIDKRNKIFLYGNRNRTLSVIPHYAFSNPNDKEKFISMIKVK